MPGTRNYRLDWLELAAQCAGAQYVPGRDTGDMLVPPNVQVLAERVNEWLEHVAPSATGRMPAAVTLSVTAT
jgi:hypothetical protein